MLKAVENSRHRFSISTIWFWTIATIILTFQAISAGHGPGLDGSYAWALNWLFAHDFSSLRELTYPIGPLAPLKMPTTEGHNLLLFLLFRMLAKGLFIFHLLKRAHVRTYLEKLAVLIVLLMTAGFIYTDLAITGLCIIMTFDYVQKGSIWKLIIAASVTAIGLCIRSSIGLICGSVLVMGLALRYLETKDLKESLYHAGLSALIPALIGLVAIGSSGGLMDYLLAAFGQSGGYSAAMSLHPDNDWSLLLLFIVSVVLLYLLSRISGDKRLLLLFLFPLFASWKHGMGREDELHYRILPTSWSSWRCPASCSSSDTNGEEH